MTFPPNQSRMFGQMLGAACFFFVIPFGIIFGLLCGLLVATRRPKDQRPSNFKELEGIS